MSPRNVIFPERFKHRKADCQGEYSFPHPISLTERLKRINDGLGAGMTLADVQHEYDAQQAEEVIGHWARKLAANPRRGPAQAAAILREVAELLKGKSAS